MLLYENQKVQESDTNYMINYGWSNVAKFNEIILCVQQNNYLLKNSTYGSQTQQSIGLG